MAERKFTKHFKLHLAEELNKYFSENNIQLECKPEHQLETGELINKIDIAVLRRKDLDNPNPSRIIGIEIEVFSSTEQIYCNYDKFKKWVHNSQYRRGGLLHLFTFESNINTKDISELLLNSYTDANRNKGMYYEFFALNDTDYRQSAKLARDLVNNSWEFDVRLFTLISKVYSRNYAPRGRE